MSDDFDPYFKWLAIPPDEQPPNHYRLLGVPLFLDDPDVIEAAADQRMMLLRSYQGGARSALSQKLLNEVSNAKVCLLNAERKADYDSNLRESSQDDSSIFGGSTADSASVGTAEPEQPQRQSDFSVVAERYAWIGIPADVWPPSDHQLLGLHPDVHSRDAVEAAVKQRWKQLRPYLDATDSRIVSAAESVLEEIKIAALNIRDEESDEPPHDPQTTPRAVPAAPRAIKAAGEIVQPSPVIQTTGSSPTARVKSQRRKTKPFPVWAKPVLGGIAALVLVIIVGSIMFSSNDRPDKPGLSDNREQEFNDDGTIEPTTVATHREPEKPVEKSDFPVGEWINVMPLIDVDQHAVEGVWRRNEANIEVQPHWHARMLIPAIPQGDFEFEFEFDGLTGKREVHLVVPVAGRSCMVVVDGWPDNGGVCYLDYVNGMPAKDNPGAVRGFLVKNKSHAKYRVEVVHISATRVTIRFSVNKKQIFRWTGNPTAISPSREYLLPNPQCLGFVVNNSAIRITNARLRGNAGTISKYVPWYGGRRPGDAVSFNGHYYKLIDFPVPWHVAQSVCRKMGGHLIRVDSAAEQRFFESLYEPINEACWIDGSDAENEGVWRFSNGMSMTWFNWELGSPNQPDNGDGEHYIVSHKRGYGFKWHDTLADFRFPFACEWGDDDEQDKSAHLKLLRTEDSADRATLGSHNYQVFDVPVTKHIAAETCKSIGGYLARIESTEEQSFVYELCRKKALASYWIDGSDAEVEGLWRFSNGEAVAKLDWVPNQPDNNSGRENSLELSTRSVNGLIAGKLNDRTSGCRTGFVCEWDSIQSVEVWNSEWWLALRECVKNNALKISATAGDAGPPNYKEIPPEGGVLVGVFGYVGEFGGNTVIRGLQFEFLTERGIVRSEFYGLASGKPFSDRAPDGYAATRVIAKGARLLDSVQFVYAPIRISAAAGSLPTEVLGNEHGGAGGRPTVLSVPGTYVVGVEGRYGDAIDSLRLVCASPAQSAND